MYFCKDNKSSNHEIAQFCISYEECQNNILILEKIIEYIMNLEKHLKEIIQQNIDLKNKIAKNESDFKSISVQKNNDKLTNLSKGKNHIKEIEKIINDFKNAINEDENGKESLNKNYNNKSEIEDEIEEIKSYYEGKIAIMDKKIKVFEILENLYIKQIDELKNKLNKNAPHKIKKFNEEIICDFH